MRAYESARSGVDTSPRILRLSSSISPNPALVVALHPALVGVALWRRLAPSVSWDGHTLPWADQLVRARVPSPTCVTIIAQGPHQNMCDDVAIVVS